MKDDLRPAQERYPENSLPPYLGNPPRVDAWVMVPLRQHATLNLHHPVHDWPLQAVRRRSAERLPVVDYDTAQLYLVLLDAFSHQHIAHPEPPFQGPRVHCRPRVVEVVLPKAV